MDEKDIFDCSGRILLNKSRRIENKTAKTSANAEKVTQKGFILLKDMESSKIRNFVIN